MASLRRLIRGVVRRAIWAPIAVLVLHEALGRWIGHEPYVDPIMHFAGGAAAAFFFRYAGSRADGLLGAPSPLALDLLAFGLTCSVALGWEFAEFASDIFRETRFQLTVAETMRDLMLGTLGGGLYLVAARLIRSLLSRRRA